MAKSPSQKVGLTGRAGRFFNDILEAYELNTAEAQLLLDAAREIAVLERLQADLDAADSLQVPGSRPGTFVAHPSLQELRLHRACLQTLCKSLAIPQDEDTSKRSAENRSSKARRAALARWNG